MKKDSGLNIVNTLSLMVVLAYIGAMPLWMWWPPEVKPEVLAIINQMMGGWAAMIATIIAYHFGSSKGAKDAADAQKDTVDKLSTTVATTATTAATVAATAIGVSPPVAPMSPGTNGADEIKTWNDAVAADTKEAFEGYLAKYPTGVRAPDAKAKVASF